MEVYIVTDTWVNHDGWAISAPELVIAFDKMENATKYIDEHQKYHLFTNSKRQLSITIVKFVKGEYVA